MLTLLLAAAFMAAAVPGAGAQESPSDSGDEEVVFTVGVTGDLNSANPLKQIDTIESFVDSMMYRGLVRYGQKDYELEPSMAESWETSEDGLTWTFHLRDDAVWSDGSPVTADDFVWTTNFIIDNEVSSYLDSFSNTAKVEAPDPKTIVWKTTEPSLVPGLPGYALVLPSEAWSKMSAKEIKQYKNFPDPIVSGPYILTEWEQGEYWKLERNPEWWGEEPSVDTYIFRVYNNDESAVQALIKGTIDFTSIGTADLFEEVKDKPGIETAIDSAESFQHLSFNVVDDPKSTANPAVLDVDVRRAIEYAIDRNTLIERLGLGYGEPGTTPIPPVYDFWHWEPPEDQYVNFDPEESKRLLDEAGYVDTDGDGVRELPGGGDPLNLRLYTEASDTVGIQMIPFIKSWLKDIGIEINTRTMTDTKLYDLWYDFDWDMLIYSWGTGPDPDFLLSSFTSGQCGYWSDTCYSNDEYDKLYLQQQTTLDRDERKAITDRMQEMLYEDTPMIVLWYPNTFEAWRGDRWEGFVRWPEPDGIAFFGNPYSVLTVSPIEGASSAASSEGIPSWLFIVAGLVVVGAVVGVVVSRRRKKGSSEGYYA
jgi:peptide/nickel transport system substrate-binding protein